MNLLYPIAHHLSCKTLPGYFKNTTVCRKRSLEPSLLVFFRSCKSSKRGFSQWANARQPKHGTQTRNPA